MKVDFYISSLSGGGAERVLVSMAKKFVCAGNDVSVVSLEKRPQFYNVDSRVNLRRIDNKGKPFGFIRDFIDIAFFAHHSNADVSISFLSRCNLLVLLALLFSKKKVVVCDRNNPRREHSSLMFWLTCLLYRRADVINVQTEQAKSFYPKKLKKKIVVIENPLDVDALKSQCSENLPRDNTILSMGRLENQKDFETLIRAFSIVFKSHPEWKVKIFGCGENEQRLKFVIDECGMTEKVFLMGRTDKSFLEMRRSNIFVLSSFYEGFPNVLCEAMLAGCLCISSDCDCGPRELIRHEDNGWLFPVQNVEKLAELLEFCISKNCYLDTVRVNAQSTVERLRMDNIFLQWNRMIQTQVS